MRKIQVYGYARKFAKIGIGEALVGSLQAELSSPNLVSASIALKAVAVNVSLLSSYETLIMVLARFILCIEEALTAKLTIIVYYNNSILLCGGYMPFLFFIAFFDIKALLFCRTKYVNPSLKMVELIQCFDVLMTVVSKATKLLPEFAVLCCLRSEVNCLISLFFIKQQSLV